MQVEDMPEQELGSWIKCKLVREGVQLAISMKIAGS